MKARRRITLIVGVVFVMVVGALGDGPGRGAGLDRYASTMNPAVRLAFFLNEPVGKIHVRGLTTMADIVTLSFWGIVFGRFAGLILTREDGAMFWTQPRTPE